MAIILLGGDATPSDVRLGKKFSAGTNYLVNGTLDAYATGETVPVSKTGGKPLMNLRSMLGSYAVFNSNGYMAVYQYTSQTTTDINLYDPQGNLIITKTYNQAGSSWSAYLTAVGDKFLYFGNNGGTEGVKIYILQQNGTVTSITKPSGAYVWTGGLDSTSNSVYVMDASNNYTLSKINLSTGTTTWSKANVGYCRAGIETYDGGVLAYDGGGIKYINSSGSTISGDLFVPSKGSSGGQTWLTRIGQNGSKTRFFVGSTAWSGGVVYDFDPSAISITQIWVPQEVPDFINGTTYTATKTKDGGLFTMKNGTSKVYDSNGNLLSTQIIPNAGYSNSFDSGGDCIMNPVDGSIIVKNGAQNAFTQIYVSGYKLT
ncbi:hypothetical protein [Paenibacillus sp. MMO-177]|uniref:hypothetical protein n=1 Tax=Paenibacillus sp. MMO-177 TaxID=3081289 RepID=UPI0030189A98